AENVDLDDLGGAHRRRGRVKRFEGRCHSVFTTETGHTFVVKDGAWVQVFRDFSFLILLEGISDAPLSYVEVGSWLYVTSITNSYKVHLPTLAISAWGRVVDHAY